MRASNDSDEDGGGKKISKKETRMLLAINASESVLIDSMTAEMQIDGCKFDVDKFVEVFRKYTPHFTQMLSGDKSDDSDDEDERPLPKKYFSFLTAFSRSSDKFIAAIEKNYKALYKKDLKEIDFSVFKSHPEEIFKSYEKSIGHANHSSSIAVNGGHSNVTQSFNCVRTEEKMDDSLARMKITNISVDTDHGSLLSAQEEELRKTIESESDTPTPTVEDWHGVKERRRSLERTNESTSKSKHIAPDAAPIVVPPVGQMYNEPRTLSSSSTHAMNGQRSSNHSSHANLFTSYQEAKNGVINIEDQVTMLMNGVKDIMREVHQDLRFALPPMIERAVRAYLEDKRPLTLREFIGEEYADERLEKFVVRMLSKDTALMQILKIEFINGGDSLVHLGTLITKEFKTNNMREAGQDREEEVEETNEEKQIDSLVAPALDSDNNVNFYPESSQFSQHLKNVGHDVIFGDGTLKIMLSKLTAIVDDQLKKLVDLKTDHLNLSHVHALEEGKAVVLKSDNGTYCRGMVHEKWTRDSGKGTVKCLLVDFGEPCEVPIEFVYAFPKWTETVPPAVAMMAKLNAYPRGATSERDTFSPSDWEAIVKVFDEWKEHPLNICIMSRNEDGIKFMIDIKNEKGDSFIDDLVERGLAQKDVTPPSSDPVPCHSPDSAALAQSHPPLLTTNSGPLITIISEIQQDDEKNKLNGIEAKEEAKGDIVKDVTMGIAIPASMNVINECGSVISAPPSSLIVKREEPERRGFLEIPSNPGKMVPSLLQFIPQPVQVSPPTVLGLNSRRFERNLVQVLDDDE